MARSGEECMRGSVTRRKWPLVVAGGLLALAVIGYQAARIPQAQLAKPAISRTAPEEIRRNVDREWVTKAAIDGLMTYWIRHSVEPNGFIQENLDRQWQPWGTQREASVNGQGRQLYAMAVAY